MEHIFEQRLAKIIKILTDSNEVIMNDFENIPLINNTGFQLISIPELEKAARLVFENPSLKENRVSFDLGCGNGAWAIIAAGAGCKSYGIEASPYLVYKARKNYEQAKEQGLIMGSCEFAVGNFYSDKYIGEYELLSHQAKDPTMPKVEGNPYDKLGVNLNEADIIYSYPWDNQTPLLVTMLRDQAPNAIILLPHGAGTSQKNSLGKVGDWFIGKLE